MTKNRLVETLYKSNNFMLGDGKMEKKLSKTLSSNLDKESLIEEFSEKVEMKLNVESELTSSLLIQRLTELYEDPIKATVRETVSNSLDSISKLDKKGLIKITRPTRLSPHFIVEDNGVGMSYEDLKNIYSKYGASTKTNDLSQIGAYGLGAKSPLSYCTEFTVTSVKDGEKVSIVVVREELKNYIKIVERSETDEENGTLLSIPVSQKDLSSFCKCIEVYSTFPISNKNVSIVIDGIEVEKESKYFCVTKDLVIYERDNEIVKGKVWMKRDPKIFSGAILHLSRDMLSSEVSFSTGGWVYNEEISSYNGDILKPVFLVELKPGIVSFNSSRDSIVKNKKYKDLVELTHKGLSSKKFFFEVIEGLKKLDEETFKFVSKDLLLSNLGMVAEKEGKPSLTISPKFTSEKAGINLDNFTHLEGWNILDRFKDLSGDERKSFSVYLIPSFYSSKINNLSHKFSYSIENELRDYSTKGLKEYYESVFFGEKAGNINENVVLMKILYKIFYDYLDTSKNSILFITNIDKENEKQTKSAFHKRKALSEFVMSKKDDDWEESHVIYTEKTKEEIEDLFLGNGIDDLFVIKKVEEALLELNVNSETKKAVPPSFCLKYLDMTSMDYKDISLSELKNSGKEVKILVSKDNCPSTLNYLKIKNWLSNQSNKDLPLEDILLVLSIGNLNNSDIETITSLGEVYELSKASSTKKYEKLIEGRNVGTDFCLNKHKNPEIKRLIAIQLLMRVMTMRSHFSDSYENAIPSYEASLKTARELTNSLNCICSAIGVKFNSVDLVRFEEMKLPKEVQVIMENVEYLAPTDLNYFSQFLTSEDKKIVEKVSIYLQKRLYGNSYQIKFKENKVTSVELPSTMRLITDFKLLDPTLFSTKKEETYSEALKRDIKSSLEIIVEFISEIDMLKF